MTLNFPNSPTTGDTFLASNGITYRYDGAKWVSQSSVTTADAGYTYSGTGAVARTIQSRLEDTVSVKDFGAVGDGVTDDTAAIQSAVTAAAGGRLYIPAGNYRVTSTVNVTHPTYIEGDGQGNTQVIFYNMGGFSGSDGFNIQVSIPTDDSLLHSTTSIVGMSILTSGAFGRDGIATPVNPTKNGVNSLFGTVRPKYVFKDLALGSLERSAVESTGMYGTYGWLNCIHIGESADSVVYNCRFIQPFLVTEAVANYAGKDNCVGVFIDADANVNDAKPIYHPIVEHITATGCGKVVRMKGKIISPRFTFFDVAACGWGIYSESPYFDGSSNLDGAGEAIIENMNLNGIFGGIYFNGTDYLDIKAVRTSFPAISSIPYNGNWYGLYIDGGFRNLNVRGFRSANFAADAVASFKLFDINSQFSTESVGSGYCNLRDLFISRPLPSNDTWTASTIRNVSKANIELVNVRASGTENYMFSHLTNVTNPQIYLSGVLDTNYTNVLEHGTGSNDTMVYFDTSETINNWKVRKLADGTAYAVKTFLDLATAGTSVNNGAMYVSTEATIDFPFTFSGTPSVQASVRTSQLVWSNARPLSSTQGSVRLFASTQQSVANIVDVVVEGRWR